MAKATSQSTSESFSKITAEIREGKFRLFYVLSGEEPYYSDIISKEIMDKALTPEERGFNQLVLYGGDTDSRQIAEAARRFPMMAQRQLVVVREAQLIKNLDPLETYLRQPQPSSILVLSFTGKQLDKRTRFYKAATDSKAGYFLESVQLKDYEMAGWISSYIAERGLSIEERAAAMLAEFSGTELRRVAVQIDKILLNMENGAKNITAEDVEKNVGISRDYNVFELANALSYRNAEKAFRIVKHFALNEKQFPLIMILAGLFSHFSKLLKYHSLLIAGNGRVSDSAAMSIGVFRFNQREIETAARNYPLKRCMSAIAVIRKYDQMGKSNERGEASDGELLQEMISRLLN
jgi:DNA polymerase-3 subunit delta